MIAMLAPTLSLPLLCPAARAADPHNSYGRLVTANGYGVAVLSGAESLDGSSPVVVDRFSDHLYQQASESLDPVRDLVYDAYFGMRLGADGQWLTGATSVAYESAYESASNVIVVERSQGDLAITERIWAPMGLEWPALVRTLRVANQGSVATEALDLYALNNVHVGSATSSGENHADEAIQARDGHLIEWGQNTGLTMHMIPVPADAIAGCEGVWQALRDGADLSTGCEREGNDLTGAFQWSVGALDPGAEATVGVIMGFGADRDTSGFQSALAAWAAVNSADLTGGSLTDGTLAGLADAELGAWQSWLAEGTHPSALSTEERAIYDQALVFLKMSQVREEGDAAGQIPASLPASAAVGEFQHEWNITWVRDGAYAIQALTRAGYPEEARAALEFMIQGKSGDYADYLPVDSYALSVCRYYGDGSEWSDWDDDGPNVELDNFGLYLWAFVDAVRRGDSALGQDRGLEVLDGVADVLVASIDGDTDLIMADSSIWERHWEGNQKHFTYTSLWAVRGLEDAAWLAEELGDDRAGTYTAAAAQIRAGIQVGLLTDDDVLVGNLEEYEGGSGHRDIAAVDAFNAGVLDPRGAAAAASLADWETSLGLSTGPGLKRNDDGDLYDEQEWIWADLRMAEALHRACRPDEALALEQWVLDHAVLNFNILPELLSPDAADYAGPAPMMGFGSGLWVLEMHHREDAAAACLEPHDTGDTGAPDTADPDTADPDTGDPDSGELDSGDPGASAAAGAGEGGGCACGLSTGVRPMPWLLGLFPVALARRRRT